MERSSFVSPASSNQEQEEDACQRLRACLDNLFEHEFQFIENEDERLERFVVILSQFSEKTLQQVTLLTYDDSQRLPLHLACDKSAPIAIIQALLEADTRKLSLETPDKWGDLALHTTCSRPNVDVVKLLLDSDVSSTTIYTSDHNGNLPLHMAVRYQAPAAVVQLLLERDAKKTTLFSKGIYNQLPLHLACRCQAPLAVIQLLLQHDSTRKSPLEVDSVGRLPIHLVLLRNPNIEVVQVLLENMLYTRFHERGLVNWKEDVHAMILVLQTHERDFNVRIKLDSVIKALQDFRKRVWELELVLWKASCLGFNNTNFDENKIETMQDLRLQQDFDTDDYKRHAHVCCGAEIIVPLVMGFLENEPIVEILRELK